jgi:hypothetical protein
MTTQQNQPGGKDVQHSQTGSTGQQTPQRSGRGFAGMDRERQREIASQGGRAAHASGNAHQFTSEEARLAGSKRHQNAAARASGSHSESEATSDENAEA